MNIEVMRQALEALDSDSPDIQLRAATALRAAIEQADKPVAWRWKALVNGEFVSNWVLTHSEPPPYATESMPLYTAPRQWVGLTDEERRNIKEWQKIQDELGPVWAPMMLYLYIAIEAKLKEKNT
jgi:hypothetical protein